MLTEAQFYALELWVLAMIRAADEPGNDTRLGMAILRRDEARALLVAAPDTSDRQPQIPGRTNR